MERSLAAGEDPLSRSAGVRLIRTMSLYHLQEKNEARAELERARNVIRPRLVDPLTASDPGGGFWFDWVISEILLDEAASVIETQ